MLELAQRHVRNTLAAEPDCLRFELVAPKDEPGVLVFSRDVRQRGGLRRAPAVGPCGLVPRRARHPTCAEANVRELRPRGAGLARCGAVRGARAGASTSDIWRR